MNWLKLKSWSPYIVGVAIGVLSWLSFLLADKPLGVSTNFSQAVKLAEEAVVPQHAKENRYFSDYKIPSKIGWEATLLVGLLIGAYVSAKISNDQRPENVPELWSQRYGPSTLKRFTFAFLGGAIVMFGARLAGGCTSGHGISGTMQLAVSSWLFFISMFLSGVITAFAMYVWTAKGGTSHV